MTSRIIGSVLMGWMAGAAGLAAQAPEPLSLHEAEQRALRNHPQVQAIDRLAQAAVQVVREVRSAYYPTAFGSVTGVTAEDGSRIAAGGLNNPLILDRFAAGLGVGQLVTDFGRTPDLVESTRLRADAQAQDSVLVQSEILLDVDRLYFAALRAQAVQRVAIETVAARQLVVDQVTALAASGLKSALDVSFAKVNLGQAQLLQVQAENDVQASFARLAAGIGARAPAAFKLADEPLPPQSSVGEAELIAQALRDRPDLSADRLSAQSALKFAEAERALWYPTIAAAGAVGIVPYRQTGLNQQYAAVGINVNVPITNGHLFSARRAEAVFRAEAADLQLRDLENRVARDVTIASLDVRTAFRRLDVASQLVSQASDALELAQSRYNLGLSSIVELTQAQLNKTGAEIEQAEARAECQDRTSVLRYQIGALKP